jgi:hypothetical protein
VSGGFQIDKDYVLTCVHVIAQALKSIKGGVILGQKIWLDYPFITSGCLLKAHIILWKSDDDVAILELCDKLQDTCTASMIPEENLLDYRFRVYGFPTNHDDGV